MGVCYPLSTSLFEIFIHEELIRNVRAAGAVSNLLSKSQGICQMLNMKLPWKILTVSMVGLL